MNAKFEKSTSKNQRQPKGFHAPIFNDKIQPISSLTLGAESLKIQELMRQIKNGSIRARELLGTILEEGDPHYAAVLELRKQSIYQFKPIISMPPIEHFKEEERKHFESIQKGLSVLVSHMNFSDMLAHCMDALSKGVSALEIIWDTNKTPWMPRVYRPRLASQFSLEEDPKTGLDQLFLVDEKGRKKISDGFARLILHKTNTGGGRGLSSLCAFTYLCKRTSLRNWVAFADVFGLPIRIGKYGMESNEEDVAMLRSAVANLGVDAAAVMPEHMKVEFIENNKSGGDKLYESLIRFLDEQMSKAVLGQTMSTDSGGSWSQAKVHDGVRLDLFQNDANQLSKTLSQQLLKPWVDLNFGVLSVYPTLNFVREIQEKTEDWIEMVARMMPFGLKVSQDDIRTRLKLSKPHNQEETLSSPSVK